MTPERYRRLREILARRQPDLTVLMDRVHKPHNLNAVIRTCDAVGVGRVHIVPGERYYERPRNSMGARRFVRLERHGSLTDALAALRQLGMDVVAAHPGPGSVDYRDIEYTRPTALLLGTELDGLTPEALAAAGRHVMIPMRGAVASLNVSVAAGVILYEAERQRAVAGMYHRPPLDDPAALRTLFEWGYPRIADLCRRRGAEYPALDDQGGIVGELPR